MKDAQKTLIKRVIYAIVIFFIVALVQFVFDQLTKADRGNANDTSTATGCINCFINGKCDESLGAGAIAR